MNNQLAGIDVSNFQGAVNWGLVRGSGVQFAAAKATEGTSFQDETFPANWAGMAQHGIARTAYHFLHPDLDGSVQADYFHRYVRDSGRFARGDSIMLDLEVTRGEPPLQVLGCAELFVLRCWEMIAKPVYIYTYPSFWQALGWPESTVLNQCPLWIADYGVPSPRSLPGWPVLSFWQHGQGPVPGVEGNVDLDIFYGTMAQLDMVRNAEPPIMQTGGPPAKAQ